MHFPLVHPESDENEVFMEFCVNEITAVVSSQINKNRSFMFAVLESATLDVESSQLL